MFSFESADEILSTDSSRAIKDFNCWWKDLSPIYLYDLIWGGSKTDCNFRNVGVSKVLY